MYSEICIFLSLFEIYGLDKLGRQENQNHKKWVFDLHSNPVYSEWIQFRPLDQCYCTILQHY